ncbi:MAG TPA: hypothetical protein EYN66_04885 [Myxococcales bacterium]|nr:hypothetical protein [Myxococcales bacterium]
MNLVTEEAMSANQLIINTDVSASDMAPMLEKRQPWRHEISFSNGLKTTDFETTTPFTKEPLNKIRALEKHLPWKELAGGRALDIGFNAGYNSVYLAQTYDMKVTGPVLGNEMTRVLYIARKV